MVAEQPDREAGVELQKRAEHVLLVPRPAASQPVERVLEGREDIVKVNQRAWFQPRQDLEKEAVDVAVDLRDMSRVDEEDVAGLELVEDAEIDVLKARLNHPCLPVRAR